MKNQLSGKFQYSMEDMECQYCLHYKGKRKPCPLDVCCCAEEKQEAMRRAQAEASRNPWQHLRDTILHGTNPCPGI